MPLFRFEVLIMAVHRVVYQVGANTGIQAIEIAQHGQVRPIRTGAADILRFEADLSTLKEIEREEEAGSAETRGVIPLYPDEAVKILTVIKEYDQNGKAT